ncbi:hypothetical protein Tco_0325460, partial [Tanacetum coccineum]
AKEMFDSFTITPFDVSTLLVEQDFKIDLNVFGLVCGSAPGSFSSGRSGVLQIDVESSTESYLVIEESVIFT